MERRIFIVLHTIGASQVKARSALEAVQWCSIPGGYRHARGVVDVAIVGGSEFTRTRSAEAPFIAFIGQPLRGIES